MADAPDLVQYGEVIGYFTSIFADSEDEGDNPDAEALNGTITLEAVGATELRWPTATGLPGQVGPGMMSLTRPIVLRVENGVLKGPNTARAHVIASIQPDATPPGFDGWKATFNFDGISPQPEPRIFSLEGGEIVNLSTTPGPSATPGAERVVVPVDERKLVYSVNGELPDGSGNVTIEGGGGGGTPLNLTILNEGDDIPIGTPANTVIFFREAD